MRAIVFHWKENRKYLGLVKSVYFTGKFILWYFVLRHFLKENK